jgi:hypothetical protein
MCFPDVGINGEHSLSLSLACRSGTKAGVSPQYLEVLSGESVVGGLQLPLNSKLLRADPDNYRDKLKLKLFYSGSNPRMMLKLP